MNKKIKVAIMADEFDRRPERTLYFRHLIERLLDIPNIELSLVHFSPMPEEPLYKKAKEILIPRIPLPFGSRFVSFILFCLTTKERFDIVHWLMPRLFPFFWFFPARKTVVMVHGGGDVVNPGGFWTFSRIIFNYTLIFFHKHVDAMIAVSEYANGEIIYAYKVPPKKVVTIYNPVDPRYVPVLREKIDLLRRQYGFGERGYFVCLSRFRPHKNIKRLIQAYILYRRKNPDADELLALGGGTKKEYEDAFGPLDVGPFSEDIRFLGYVEVGIVPALYTGAVALAFISLNEGFGLPVVEAMACGTAVITSSATSLPEVAGDAALIVDPYSVSDIAFALKRVAHDTTLRDALIAKGFVRSRFFTWEKVMEKTLRLYETIP